MRTLACVVATLLGSACAMEVGELEEFHEDHEQDEAELLSAAYEELQDSTLLLDHPEVLEDILRGDGEIPAGVNTIAATSCSGVVPPDTSGFAKRIALTFDDGPNPLTTPKVIEILKKHNAPATFFTNGSRYSSTTAKNLANKIADDPLFILANHSQNHLNLATQTAAKVSSEIDRTTAPTRASTTCPCS
jgi:peptidoglycan/xylan/chitin deacetylase (PgdA/CDA1 family)